jgi:hypothetical protein
MKVFDVYVTGDWTSNAPLATVQAESWENACAIVATDTGRNVLTLQAFEQDLTLPVCPQCGAAYDGFCLICARRANASTAKGACIGHSPHCECATCVDYRHHCLLLTR